MIIILIELNKQKKLLNDNAEGWLGGECVSCRPLVKGLLRDWWPKFTDVCYK